jgi:ankyrin repeat protein
MDPKKHRLKEACRVGDLNRIRKILENGVTEKKLNLGLFGACRGGHIPAIELMIKHGAKDLNLGLFGACCGGHVPAIELMLQILSPTNIYAIDDLNSGLNGACYGGHIAIINRIIQMIEAIQVKYFAEYGLYFACIGGHIPAIELMLERLNLIDETRVKEQLNLGLSGASRSGHIPAIEFMISNGANAFDTAITAAAKYPACVEILECYRDGRGTKAAR